MTRRPTTRRPRARRARRVVGAVVAVTLLAAFLLPALVAVRVVQVADRDERVAADAILVLGAAQLDGTPGAVLEARLQQALELYEEGLAPVVVTTGGNQEGDRTTEADSGKEWLVSRGVPGDAVLAVAEGGDTYDSLVPVAALARESGWQGVLVVSDPWHVYRVRTMADDLDLPVAGTSPTRVGPSNEVATRVVSYVTRETGGVLVHHGSILVERLQDLAA